MERKSTDWNTIRWLCARVKKQWIRIGLLVLGNALFSISMVLFALLCRNIIDSAVYQKQEQLLYNLAGLAGLIAAQLILRLFCNSMREYIKARIAMNLRQYIFELILKKEYAGVECYHSGELLNRMFSDVQIISDNVTGILPTLVNALTRLFFAAGILIYLDQYFSTVFLIATVFIYALIKLLRGKMKGLHKEVQRREDKVRSFLQEMLENLRVLKVFEVEEKVLQKSQQRQNAQFQMQMKQRTFHIAANAGFYFIFQVGYFCALSWGAWGLYRQTMTYGTLTALLQLVGQIQTPLTSLSGMMPQWYHMLASAERIMEIECIENQVRDKKREGITIYKELSAITLRNVEFGYDRNTVLNNVNIFLKKGTFTAVTGLSGGGKSTLFSLIMGLYEPLKGEVYCELAGGQTIPVRSIRGLFAYVPQGNCLFSGTLRENLLLLNEQAGQEEIDRVLKVVCADDFVGELPKGLDTYIGEDGAGLSEGQAQRIALARALLKEAPVLLLDEATSALDEETERRLLDNIAALKNKMCLIVTHRKAALQICDSRIVIKDGNVYESNQ